MFTSLSDTGIHLSLALPDGGEVEGPTEQAEREAKYNPT
jgi:hypothetical protein